MRQLICHTIDKSYASAYPAAALDYFKAFHSEENIAERSRQGKTLVAERTGQIYGTGSLVDHEILGVFVDPETQGQGIGLALMQALEASALQSGFTETQLSVSIPSKISI